MPFQTITKTPSTANPIYTQVSRRIASARRNHPRNAVRNGAAAKRNIALATDVACIAKIPPENASTKPSPPSIEAIPAFFIMTNGAPFDLIVIIKNKNGANASER